MTNQDIIELYQAGVQSPALALVRQMSAAGIEPLKTCPSPTGGSGSVMRLTSDQADRHGLVCPNGAVLASFPRPMRVSAGGDSIRDASAGRVYAAGEPLRVYYDGAVVVEVV